MARRCCETTTLGNYTVKAGEYVQADLFTIHLSEEIWGPDAKEFRPERWFEDSTNRPQMSWLGFGAGPRICIGMKMAYLEEKLTLVYILRNYNLRRPNLHKAEELKLTGTSVLDPETVMVRLEKRQ